MKTTVFIVLERRGPVRMTKRAPDLARNEIAIGLRLEVPDSAFRAPTIIADLTVPDHAVIVPEIKVEVEDPPAQVGRNPEGQDREDGLGAQHDHAVAGGDAPQTQGGDHP